MNKRRVLTINHGATAHETAAILDAVAELFAPKNEWNQPTVRGASDGIAVYVPRGIKVTRKAYQ